jgi:hypothetical protein
VAISAGDLRFALRSLRAIRRRQHGGKSLTRRGDRVASAASENLLPTQLVRAGQRDAAMRAWLLSTGYVTYATLARRRGGSVNAARAFVARGRAANRVFTVRHEARTLIPALLFDEVGRVTAVSRAVEVLRPVGVDGWALWGWLATPSGWLSGRVPAEILIRDPDRGLAAVRAYATSLEDAPPVA